MPDPGDVARTIKEEWERRARSPSREFFVASHEGWDSPESRERQARSDAALMLTAVDLDATRSQDALEIGCGSGRLVPYVAPHFRSYTGIDVSKTMIEAARERCRDLPNARFAESDGVSLPEEARDRLYDFALAVAVLIHCPKDVCEALVAATMRQLRKGGQLRLQVFADYDDPEGIAAGEGAAVVEDTRRIEASVTPEQAALIASTHYVGHRFRFAEARAWLSRMGAAQVFRPDRVHMYAVVGKT
jgi:SAM-dependent methyltransferase